MMTTRARALLCLLTATAALTALPSAAQSPVPSPGADRRQVPAARSDAPQPTTTTLHIDLLMSEPTQALQSQTWGRVFDSFGKRVRIRTGGIADEPELTETVRGPLRTVKLVGQIDRRGTLSFPGKTFKPGDDKALKEWLDELEAYGAQGSPVGQPRWGLSTDQFQTLFTSLAEDVTTDFTGKPLIDVARSMGFGIEIPFRIHDSVAAKWSSATMPLVAMQDVRSLTRGSALAVLLNDHGLCIRPLRTPSGSVELVVLDIAQTPDPWPMGWEPRPEVQRSDYAPALFAFGPIGFLDRPLPDTLADAREQTGCGFVLDLPAIARKEIDLSKRIFGIPRKTTAWTLVLDAALAGTGLKSLIRIDEAGRGFVLIAPLESRSTKR